MDEYTLRMLAAIVDKFGMEEDQAITLALEAYCIKRNVKPRHTLRCFAFLGGPSELEAFYDLLCELTIAGPITKTRLGIKSLPFGPNRENLLKELAESGRLTVEIRSRKGSGRPTTYFNVVPTCLVTGKLL